MSRATLSPGWRRSPRLSLWSSRRTLSFGTSLRAGSLRAASSTAARCSTQGSAVRARSLAARTLGSTGTTVSLLTTRARLRAPARHIARCSATRSCPGTTRLTTWAATARTSWARSSEVRSAQQHRPSLSGTEWRKTQKFTSKTLAKPAAASTSPQTSTQGCSPASTRLAHECTRTRGARRRPPTTRLPQRSTGSPTRNPTFSSSSRQATTARARRSRRPLAPPQRPKTALPWARRRPRTRALLTP
eukprot:Amastigsp_a1051_12.p4 type:complete len:246 gc:universal Amastigsp_a1051_12:1921-1184(-)